MKKNNVEKNTEDLLNMPSKDYEEYKQWKAQKERNIWVNLGIEFFVFGIVVLYWLYDYFHRS